MIKEVSVFSAATKKESFPCHLAPNLAGGGGISPLRGDKGDGV